MYDVAIIGGGVLGNMTARELSRYQLNIIVLEKEYDVGEGTTKANSGIIHAGFHPRGGSLKGISCVKGNSLYPSLCEELDIPFRQIGSLFLAFHEDGKERLKKIWDKGTINGVPGMRMVGREEILEMEPMVNPKVVQAVYAPSTGIISPFDLVVALAESAALNGVTYSFHTQTQSIECLDGCFAIHTNRDDIRAKYIVNTAGGFAGKIESMVRPVDLIIKPKRGQYYVLDKEAGKWVSHVLYQAAETDEGGTLLTPTVDGNLLVGPTAEAVPGFNHVQTTEAGLAHVEKVAKKMLPAFDLSKVITSFAGLRANITNVAKEDKDFVIRSSAPRFISALGIKNPGMTCSPALAGMMIELLAKEGLRLEKKKDFIPQRTRIRRFLELTPQEQEKLLALHPEEGRVICRCEGITEGDIVRALKRPVGTTSLDGIKKRLRLGMGRCQGGFCTMHAIEILSRELQIPPEKVLKNIAGSHLVAGSVK